MLIKFIFLKTEKRKHFTTELKISRYYKYDAVLDRGRER